MSPQATVGIDIGTSSIKAGLYRLDGTALALASRSVALERRDGGQVTQDLDDFYAASAAAVRQCVEHSGLAAADVAAIAIDGQMAGIGIVDAAHRPLAPYDSWLDSRCQSILAGLGPELAGRILLSSGCAPTISGGPKMAWWSRQRPDITSRAAAFVTAGSYVAARAGGLSGEQAYVDPTYLHFLSVADNAAGRWDLDLAGALGVEARLLPRIVPATSLVGSLTASAAADFGLLAGTPIAAGCGDTAACALGAGAMRPGQGFDVAGTAAVLGVCLDRFAPDPSGTLLVMRSPIAGRWHALAYVGGAGEIIEWLCTVLLGHKAADDDAYAELAQLAGLSGIGARGLIVSPHFSGRIAPAAPAMRGTLVGLNPLHGRAEIVRATLEAIAFEYRGYADAAGSGLTEVLAMGGGTKLAVWNQIKADVLGATYRPLRGVEAGCRGSALVAMAAIGAELPDLAETDYGIAAKPASAPGALNAYNRAYQRYRAWTGQLAASYAAEPNQDHHQTR